jgi:FkbM family methyltransferase
LVGDYKGIAKFYKNPDIVLATGNSMFKETTKYFEDAIEEEVPIDTIDNILRDFNLTGKIQLMKMDIQGAELVALKGAMENLPHMEVSNFSIWRIILFYFILKTIICR